VSVVRMPVLSTVDINRPGEISSEAATLTVPQLAKYLKLSLGTTYQYLRQGIIPARRIGRRWVISRRRIDVWLDEVEVVPEPEPVSATGTEPYPWEVR
jgi:excisionase family DNA binding protein